MERRKGTFNGNRNGNRNGSRGNFGKRTFGPTDAYELPSAASTLEEKVIVAALKRCGGDGVPSRSLQREAGIHDKDAFYDALHSLKGKGEITVDKDHWVKLVPRGGDIEAQIVSLSERFGFARPKLGGEDIFVPGSALKGAFVGDQVILTDLQKRDKGPSGRVKRIVARSEGAHDRHCPRGRNRRPRHPRRLPALTTCAWRAASTAPRTWTRCSSPPSRTAGATGPRRRFSPCSAQGRGPASALTPSSSGAASPLSFPRRSWRKRRRFPKWTVTPEDIAQRLDLRDEPIFTIDSADAKDLDDAICVHKTENGYKLGVHIADVSHYVKAKSAIDNEAYRRGTSVYFADRVIPMLPEALSNGVCSLNAGTEKLTFSALMEFDTQGNMTHYEFRKAVINSKVRGVYSEVNEILAGTASQQLLDKYAPVMDSLMAAYELFHVFQKAAEARGNMDLSSDETKFVLDENGVCVQLLPRTTGEAEQLIEQMMIAANIASARAALKAEIPFLYRVHERPQPDRVDELAELLERLGIPCRELRKGKPSTKDFGAILDRVKGTPRESLVNQRVLRTMEKAHYADREIGHFGLALGEYSHFTSPIRRYPDTSIHRILSDLVAGADQTTLKRRYGEFTSLAAAQSSQTEVRAVTGERSAEDCYIAEYMKAHLGERHTGIISGVTPKGIFVKLENNAEGFVSLNEFENREFEYDGEVSHRDLRSGRVLMMGEEIGIIVAAADVATGRVDFVPQEP